MSLRLFVEYIQVFKTMRPLGRIAHLDAGIHAITSQGGVSILEHVLADVADTEFHSAEEEDLTLEINRILFRLAKDPTALKQLKQSQVTDALLTIIDRFPAEEQPHIQRVIGKTINKISGDTMDDLLSALQEGHQGTKAQERTMRLLAALAVGDGQEQFSRSGGVGTIINNFENMVSARAIEETAKAIARFAASRTNIGDTTP